MGAAEISGVQSSSHRNNRETVMHNKLMAVGFACMLAVIASAPQAGEPALSSAIGATSADASVQTELKAVFARFISGQNAHDTAVVSDVLLHSPDFVWAQYGGNSLWGYKEAMAAFQEAWKGSWHLDPHLKELRIVSIAPGVALLITPQLYTDGDPGEKPSTVPVRWGGIFVKTSAGWRISSIFITPFKHWRASTNSPGK